MRWDDRGQSIQIGAVILFGALVIALSGYQAFVVPQQNEQVEFSHSQQVQGELGDLRNALVSVPGDSATRSVTLSLGTRYPARVFGVNPGPPSGSLRTAGTDDPTVAVTIENAVADGEAGDFWTGASREYRTGGLTYRPNYNEYRNAPTTRYEHGALVNAFDAGEVPLSGQPVVDGDRITVVALNGSLDATRAGTRSVDVRPVSSSTTTVTVTDDGSPVRMEFPTQLSQSTWEELLADETAPDGHVISVSVTATAGPFDTLVLELQQGVEYDLWLAKAGVGTGVTDTTEAYATDVSGDNATVREGESRLVVVEVRDRYNNPVSGVRVEGVAAGGTFDDTSATTGADGRATFLYTAADNAGGVEYDLRFSYDDPTTGFAAGDPEDVEMTVNVAATGASGASESAYDLEWRDPSDPDYELDVSQEGASLDMTAVVSDAAGDLTPGTVEDATVDFGLSDSTVGTLSDGDAVTDADGEASTTFTAEENGTVRVYATVDGASDILNLTVTNVTGQADPGFPYEDVNQDGRYQSDTDVALDKSDVEGSYTAASGNGLVVPSSTGPLDAGGDPIDWEADGITVAVDVTGDQVTMDAGTQALTADGITVDSPNDVDLRGDSVDLTGSAVDNYFGGSGNDRPVGVTATGGDVAASGLTVDTANDLTVDGAAVDVSGASFNTYQKKNGFGAIDVSGSGSVTATNAALDAANDLTVSGTAVDVSGATLDNYQNGNGDGRPVTVETTGGDLVATGATVASENDITLTGNSGDIDLSGASVNNYQGGDGFGAIDATADGALDATNADLDAYDALTLTGASVDVSDAVLNNYHGKDTATQAIDVTAFDGALVGDNVDVDSGARIEFTGDSLDLTDGDLNNYQGDNGNGGNIVLTAMAEDMVLEGVVLTTRKDDTWNLQASGIDTAGDDLFVEGAEFYEGNTNGNNGELYNENGVDVNGTPARGSVVTA